MTVRVTESAPLLLAGTLGAAAVLAVGLLVAPPLLELATRRTVVPESYDAERLVLLHATLPRLVMALLCGAGLGAAGAILQQVLRNPLASPTTLGVDGGARLGLAITAVFAPTIVGIGRDLIALLGSTATTLLVLALGRRRGFSALSLVLAGLVVSLYCGALSALLVLAGDRYVASLFIWGSGSLAQQSWGPVTDLAWRLGLVVLPVVLLLRPLSLLDLDERSAASLGVPVRRLRVIAIAVAVALSAFVTSAVGVLGFIGLVAPVLARLSGARRFLWRLPLSALIGAFVLLLTDACVQWLGRDSAQLLPTGAVTAVLASPLLLVLLPRLRSAFRPLPAVLRAPPLQHSSTATRCMLAVGAVTFVVTLALLVGRSPTGAWQLAAPADWSTLAPWRAPRLVAASCAGMLLGLAGVILQRMTSNEMASPEVLGVSAGSILAAALALFLWSGAGPVVMNTAGLLGAVAVLGIIMLLGRGAAFAPERVLLAGIALNALIDAVVGVVSATGDPRAYLLLGWMSGSTGGTLPGDALAAALAVALLLPVSLLTSRWLTVLPLGTAPAAALGVPVARARLMLLALAALLTAAATFVIGPLSFVGLMAPHVALLLGFRRTLPLLLVAAVTGAGILAVADTLARTIAFPMQLPTGLTAALVGAPFLMFLLQRRR